MTHLGRTNFFWLTPQIPQCSNPPEPTKAADQALQHTRRQVILVRRKQNRDRGNCGSSAWSFWGLEGTAASILLETSLTMEVDLPSRSHIGPSVPFWRTRSLSFDSSDHTLTSRPSSTCLLVFSSCLILSFQLPRRMMAAVLELAERSLDGILPDLEMDRPRALGLFAQVVWCCRSV